jgi:hypothetical protein
MELICKYIEFWEPLLTDYTINLNGSELKFTRDLCKSPTEAEISFSPSVLNYTRAIRTTSNLPQTLPTASNNISNIDINISYRLSWFRVFSQELLSVLKPMFSIFPQFH